MGEERGEERKEEEREEEEGGRGGRKGEWVGGRRKGRREEKERRKPQCVTRKHDLYMHVIISIPIARQPHRIPSVWSQCLCKPIHTPIVITKLPKSS